MKNKNTTKDIKTFKVSTKNLKSDNKQITPDLLRKQCLIIMLINIGIFGILCLAAFIVIILPILQWMYALGQSPLKDYLLKVWFIGIPILAVAIIYGVTLFWPLLVKFNHIDYKNHDIDIYLGVKTVIICVDRKVVGYATHGFYSCPKISWYLEIDDEYVTIDVVAKNQYDIQINSEPINLHKVELKSENECKISK